MNAFGADVFNMLKFPTKDARSSAQRICVRLAANDLELDSAQYLLTLLESQPDLMKPEGDFKMITKHP